MSRVHSGQGAVIPTCDVARAAVAGLTKVQRMYVKDGCIHGDCSMTTARALMRKGLFSLEIDSPNGQWGFLRLTPLGREAQQIIKARTAINGPSVGTKDEVRSEPNPTETGRMEP